MMVPMGKITELQIPAGPSKLKRKGLNLLNKFCQWKYAVVTKAWPDELQTGMGGIGEVVRVWHTSFEFSDANEPVYLLHPKSHLKHLKFTGANLHERYPFYLSQAIRIL